MYGASGYGMVIAVTCAELEKWELVRGDGKEEEEEEEEDGREECEG
jgi:hypothetical protein